MLAVEFLPYAIALEVKESWGGSFGGSIFSPKRVNPRDE